MTDAMSLPLAEAVDQIYYGANCCGEVRKIDLHKLLADLGPDFLVRDIRPRLKCSKCGGKDLVVTTLWKSSTTTDRLMEAWK